MCLKFLAKGKNQISETRMEIHTILKDIHPWGAKKAPKKPAGPQRPRNRSRKDIEMNIEKIRIFDVSACLREAQDDNLYLMAEKFIAKLEERQWWILFAGHHKETDILVEIHTMVTQLLEARGKES